MICDSYLDNIINPSGFYIYPVLSFSFFLVQSRIGAILVATVHKMSTSLYYVGAVLANQRTRRKRRPVRMAKATTRLRVRLCHACDVALNGTVSSSLHLATKHQSAQEKQTSWKRTTRAVFLFFHTIRVRLDICDYKKKSNKRNSFQCIFALTFILERKIAGMK